MSLGLIHEITGRCNLACAFCYNPWRSEGSTPGELEAEEVCGLLEGALRDSGAEWLTFTGGEPLLYHELERVMSFVRRRFPKVRLGLATNGILLPARLGELLAAGLTYIEISLFAGRADTYHQLSGADLVDAPIRALALARSKGIATTAATVLRAGLEAELEQILKVAHAVGADRLALNRFAPRGRGRINLADHSPSIEELDRLLALADRLAQELRFHVTVATPVEDCLLPHRRFPHLAFGACVCGQSKWAIDPEGFLRVCEMADVRLGNLRESSFAELARRPEVSGFRRADRRQACGECPSRSRCGGGCRFTPGEIRLGTANSGDGGGR